MAEITGPGEKVQAEKHSGRKVLIGTVVSNKMQKTIVVEVTRKKAHPMYKRVISIRKKFYAHDEKNEAKVGDTVVTPAVLGRVRQSWLTWACRYSSRSRWRTCSFCRDSLGARL